MQSHACSGNGPGKYSCPHCFVLTLKTVLHVLDACNSLACLPVNSWGDQGDHGTFLVGCALQAAEVQLSCGMRTKNGGGHQHQPAEESQKKKGNKHITMLYLEQGGYFDVPIHVSHTALSSHLCLHDSLLSAAHCGCLKFCTAVCCALHTMLVSHPQWTCQLLQVLCTSNLLGVASLTHLTANAT